MQIQKANIAVFINPHYKYSPDPSVFDHHISNFTTGGYNCAKDARLLQQASCSYHAYCYYCHIATTNVQYEPVMSPPSFFDHLEDKKNGTFKRQTKKDRCKIPRVIRENGGYVVSDVSHSPYCLAGELQISTGREMKFRTFIAPRSFYNDSTAKTKRKKIAPEKRSIDLVCFGQSTWTDLTKRMIPPKTVELLQMENNEYPPMQHVQYEANFLDQHRDWIDVLLEGLKDPNRYEKIELLRERPLSPSHE
uniref:Uncharacterized protein n=1 Tax=Ditylenchus dipsaci TaxID=166011 RepID=A0A915E137_9BILA